MARPLPPTQLAILRVLASGNHRLAAAELRARLRAMHVSEREVGIGLRALMRRGLLRRPDDAPHEYELAEAPAEP